MAAPHPDNILDLERQVIGAALHTEANAATVAASFPAERFTDPQHRRIAAAIERIVQSGERADLVSVGSSVPPGDAPTVSLCASERGALVHGMDYPVQLLTEAYLARTLQAALQTAVANAAAAVRGESDVFDVAEQTQRAVSELILSAQTGTRADTHIAAAVAEALARVDEWARGESTDFAPSGFYTLDRAFGGYPIGELTTLAAMTGAGKTSLVCQVVASIARAEASKAKHKGTTPAPVIVFSAEMSREQIAHRAAAGLARINIRTLRAGKGRPEELERYRAALRYVATLTIHVDDEPSPTFSHIRSRLQQIRQSAPDGRLALVAVDYDEKIDAHGASEELRVSAIARGLKDLAKRFTVAILGLSQYKRVDGAHRMQPANEWLRYSGKKEHESAMIAHWWHPGYWVEKGLDGADVDGYDPLEPQAGRLIITKNRFGPTGHIDLLFDAETTSFHDPAEPEAARSLQAPF